MTDTPTTPEPLRESVLAQRLNIPRAKFKEWREDGHLLENEHWLKDAGGAYLLTLAGQERVLALVQITPEQAPVVPVTVPVMFINPGAMKRVARCKLMSTGTLVSVKLTGDRVFADRFRRGDKLDVLPTDVEGIYTYDGAVPRRMRL